jgi:hypothetical protein
VRALSEYAPYRYRWFADGAEVKISFADVEEAPVPEEKVREHVKCSHDGCKSIFWRPQEVIGDAVQSTSVLSTIDLAQLHGWTLIDREKGLLHCAWGHKGAS